MSYLCIDFLDGMQNRIDVGILFINNLPMAEFSTKKSLGSPASNDDSVLTLVAE